VTVQNEENHQKSPIGYNKTFDSTSNILKEIWKELVANAKERKVFLNMGERGEAE
jgi:hypothetical protein